MRVNCPPEIVNETCLVGKMKHSIGKETFYELPLSPFWIFYDMSRLDDVEETESNVAGLHFLNFFLFPEFLLLQNMVIYLLIFVDLTNDSVCVCVREHNGPLVYFHSDMLVKAPGTKYLNY